MVKEFESKRKKKFFEVNEPGQQILDLNFEVSEVESLEKPTVKGTQTGSKIFDPLLRKPNRLQYLRMIPLAWRLNLSNEQILLPLLLLL